LFGAGEGISNSLRVGPFPTMGVTTIDVGGRICADSQHSNQPIFCIPFAHMQTPCGAIDASI
jgi:hypothetical protein